jgi:high affinity sulfate transporter 1
MPQKKSAAFHLSFMQGVLPIRPSQVPRELIAGLTLAALAIPTVMGYSKIAGMPVVTGLYTILIPMFLFALFGSSRHLVISADSATAAILAAGLVGIAASGSDQYLALAGVLALLAAGLLFLARIVHLGFMANFLSRTVLIGFLTGVGIQVALGEISGMLGLKGGGWRGALDEVWIDLDRIDQVNFHALGIAVAVLLVIAGAKRISNRAPGPLIAVVGAIAASWAFGFKDIMPVVGPVPLGLPDLALPQVQWSWGLIRELLPTAFAMFIVILAQSAATSRAYAARYNEKFSEDTDLIGLGLANIGAGLSGTFVVNGSPTQSQMVDDAGGRTQLSAIVAASLVLLVLLFFTAPIAFMPEAVLSAVVFRIAIGLVDIKGMRNIFAYRRSEFGVALITAATVVFVGVEQGIILAMILSMVDHIRRSYHPRNLVLAPSPSLGVLQARPVATGWQAEPGLVIYRFTHGMYYANTQQMTDEITTLVSHAKPPLKWLCIDASAVDDIDFSAAKALDSLSDLLKSKGVKLVVTEVMDDVHSESRDLIGVLFGEDCCYDTLDDVLHAYRKQFGEG